MMNQKKEFTGARMSLW